MSESSEAYGPPRRSGIRSVMGPGTATRMGRSAWGRAKRNSSTMPRPCGAVTRSTTS